MTEHEPESGQAIHDHKSPAERSLIDAGIPHERVIFDHATDRWVPFDPAIHGTHYDSDDWMDPK